MATAARKVYPSLVAARAAKARKRAERLMPPTLEVEHDVPLPANNRGGWPTTVWPFDKMEVGDSFFVPSTSTVAKYKRSRFSTITHAHKVFRNQPGNESKMFTCRTLADGIRCWRIQ